MVLQQICPPAFIYFMYMTAQIAIDVSRGYYNTALLKFWMAIIITILLNHLCASGLGIFSWFIVSIPIILMTLIIAALLMFFGLDPKTGKLKIKNHKYVTNSSYSGLANAQTKLNEREQHHQINKHEEIHKKHQEYHNNIKHEQHTDENAKHLALHEKHLKDHLTRQHTNQSTSHNSNGNNSNNHKKNTTKENMFSGFMF